MPVKYILLQAGRKIGLSPSKPQDRTTLLLYLNEAARELYDQSDMDGILMEQVFKVNADQTISLPYYVGALRAIRSLYSNEQWHINKLQPRYSQINWKDQWKNFRLRNLQALQYTNTNASVGVITVPTIEDPPIVVTVVGPTTNASSATEAVTMDALTKNTTGAYIDYVTVAKDRINTVDVTLSDADGNLLTTIPNCMYEARYQIVDVSTYPFNNANTSLLNNYLEILYKKALTSLFNDSDSFPSKTDYDDILVNKMLQLYSEDQGKAEEALAYDSKATRSLARKHEDANRSTEDMINLSRHPHDRVHTRISGSRRFYLGWWGGRR